MEERIQKMTPKFQVGDEVRYCNENVPGRGIKIRATIVRQHGNGSATIKYFDGRKTERLKIVSVENLSSYEDDGPPNAA